jgi:hypothetical protein
VTLEQLVAADASTVAAALRDDPALVRATTAEHDTLLHLACWQKRADLVALLLNAGADVNVAGCYGRTPLHYAVHEGGPESVPLVAALRAVGASPTLTDDFGHTVAAWAEIEMVGALDEVLALLRGPVAPGRPPTSEEAVAAFRGRVGARDDGSAEFGDLSLRWWRGDRQRIATAVGVVTRHADGRTLSRQWDAPLTFEAVSRLHDEVLALIVGAGDEARLQGVDGLELALARDGDGARVRWAARGASGEARLSREQLVTLTDRLGHAALVLVGRQRA